VKFNITTPHFEMPVRINFFYPKKGNKKVREPRNERRKLTVCSIIYIDPDTKEQKELRGEAKCHKNDKFDMELGREHSLAHALAENGYLTPFSSKTIREEIWKHYRNRRGEEITRNLNKVYGEDQSPSTPQKTE
jgi:hypothetical protein